ncbi:MAG TPA: hypothetical protein VKT49_12395 [Bryobacteraceae bacterium]|nr:hypothetical protein [Bryobacteraceae bacterium]
MSEPWENDYRDAAGTITICMHCGRARRAGAGDHWEVVREFLIRPPAGISHGLCPDCLEKHYPPGQA